MVARSGPGSRPQCVAVVFVPPARDSRVESDCIVYRAFPAGLRHPRNLSTAIPLLHVWMTNRRYRGSCRRGRVACSAVRDGRPRGGPCTLAQQRPTGAENGEYGGRYRVYKSRLVSEGGGLELEKARGRAQESINHQHMTSLTHIAYPYFTRQVQQLHCECCVRASVSGYGNSVDTV